MAAVVTPRRAEPADRGRVARAALTVATAVLYGIGWAAAHVAKAVVIVAVWCAAAVRVGWTDGTR